ncbi:MAG: PAS domain-containing sensor histidine kinase [Promethearchaeota archaeon]
MSSNLKNDEKEPKISNSIGNCNNSLNWDFIDKIPLPSIIIDDNNRIIKLNQLASSLFKYDKIDLLNNSFLKLCESCSLGSKYFKSLIQKATFSKDLIQEKEILMKRKDNSNFWAQISIKPLMNQEEDMLYYLLTLIDISKYKNSEESLNNSEAYQIILKNVNEAFYKIDLRGNFIFFNDAFCKLTGYVREELLNLNLYKLFDEKSVNKIISTLKGLLEGKIKDFCLIELELARKDGSKLHIESSLYISHGKNKKINGFFCFTRDITQRKNSEKIKNNFQRELEKRVQIRTNQLKRTIETQKHLLDEIIKAYNFKSDFLATISHELRTPLNAIIGFTDLLLDQHNGTLTKEQLEYVSDIKQSSEKLLSMIVNILDISKIESGKMSLKFENINLYALIHELDLELKPLCQKKNLELKIIGINKNDMIFADKIKFKQILYNLLHNAIKFTNKGNIYFQISQDKNNWIFSIQNTDVRANIEKIQKLFNESQPVISKSFEPKGGLGFEFYLTKRLIQLHGGYIWVDNYTRDGVTFKFIIPKRIKNRIYQKLSDKLINFLNSL